MPREISAYLLVPGGSNYGAVVEWGGERVIRKLEAGRNKDGSLHDSWGKGTGIRLRRSMYGTQNQAARSDACSVTAQTYELPQRRLVKASQDWPWANLAGS